jgi:hypothetical protein
MPTINEPATSSGKSTIPRLRRLRAKALASREDRSQCDFWTGGVLNLSAPSCDEFHPTGECGVCDLAVVIMAQRPSDIARAVMVWDDNGPTNVELWLAEYLHDENFFWKTPSGHHLNVIDALIGMVTDLYGDAHHAAIGNLVSARSDESAPFFVSRRIEKTAARLGVNIPRATTVARQTSET